MKQVFSHEDKYVSVSSFGKSFEFIPETGNTTSALKVLNAWAVEQNLEDVLWQRLPNDTRPERRFTVEFRNSLPHATSDRCVVNNEFFDGVILTEAGQSVVFATRDCPVVVIYSTRGGPVAVLHAGRTATQGYDINKPRGSVIESAFALCYDSIWDHVSSLRATISVSIAPKHFPNDRYPKIIDGLKNRWGDSVIADHERSTIDLVALIKAQLKNFASMCDDQITWDETDTVSDSRLSSNRCQDFHIVNTTHVIKKSM